MILTVTITDYSASTANVNAVFNGLANGTGNFPQITPDDFLLVWTFDHGGLVNGNATLHLIDGAITDDDFASLVNPIQANKKVFWMEQCHSGGFADELEGPTTFFQSACEEDESAWRANDTPEIENEIINNIPYHHGEFFFHVFSVSNGSSPTGNLEYDDTPYTDADENNDNYLSLYEIWEWADDQEDNPNAESLLSDEGDIGEYTSLEYPTLLHVDITDNESYRGLIGISKDIHVFPGKQLQLFSNADVYLLNNANLIVDAGATLIIEDNVRISGNSSNKIIVEGNIQIGNNVNFNRSGNSGYFGGLHINNQNASTTLNQTIFTKARMHNYGDNLIVNDCNFDDCYIIHSHRGTVTFTNSDFSRTWLYIENTDENDKTAIVANCNFTTDITMAAIDLCNYDNYRIENNTMNGFYNGIQLWQSGDGNMANYHHIHNNEIFNSNLTGITAYDSKVSISMNHIHNNAYGIRLNNKCNVAMYGAYNATSYNEMNYITNNTSYELYISKYSFPWYFRYNAIIDDDNIGNPSDPLLYFDYPTGGKINQKDIRYNCWTANNDFVASEDLYPYEYFTYSPTWCPNGSPIPIGLAEQMYLDGEEQFDNQQYSNSKATFQLLIEQYPKTKYAESAMKELINTLNPQQYSRKLFDSKIGI